MEKYSNPLAERYSSKEMLYNFSPENKFRIWRKLWIILAEAEKELGLDFITEEQIEELKKFKDDVDFEMAAQFEKKLRHDVMSHVHTYGEQAKNARKIIHLGATSAYVGDNTDLIQIKEGLLIIRKRLLALIQKMKEFALKYKSLPTLGFTHFQPAQLTTVGKRATLWLHSLLMDFEELEFRIEMLRYRGVKGTTGTQASFKELFDGNFKKVKKLDSLVTEKAGFKIKQSVSGQTYDRKTDAQILNLLSDIAQSSHKFSNDFRLLQHLKELEEPFERNQIGSSAMAYKRNPMRSERISSLAKFVMSLSMNGALVYSTQWFERTLDDSANKRLSIPQAFLAVDAILIIWLNIMDGVVVYPKVIESNIQKELPFMATENIIMESVKKGMDRQEVHEIIRELSMEETKEIKTNGKSNNLIQRIIKDGRLGLKIEDIENILISENYIGFADKQTEDFINEEINPLIEKYKNEIDNERLELKV
ncbi:adenylosuccinate lyase [Leptotrichia sp. OH3620_COT-345]|uniref:adenylosuccinate lyase n=1 Tax=Leptotrichia sp. OH3620_COT-345 TaxID=2491048 RepID=UPI000F64D5AD|nr:adenylosuccinate lyase [Leptotrichia sp. OH3620_COT-345]RRD39145.1 adenylosuccinate lyase [Leptotrichia sp. OH3620_COT-345]